MNVFLRVVPASSKRMTVCLKISLCVYNVVFLVLGVILVAMGLVGVAYVQSLIELASKFTVFVRLFFIGSGFTLFAFGLLGILAAISSNTFMLKLYSLFLILAFLGELATAIIGYIYREDVQDVIGRAFREAQFKYTGFSTAPSAVDSIQQTMGCCGFKQFYDWNVTSYFNVSGIPFSCCINKDNCSPFVLVNLGQAATQVYQVGCLTRLSELLSSYVGAVAGAAIGIGLFQLIGVVMALCLCRYITHSFIGMPR